MRQILALPLLIIMAVLLSGCPPSSDVSVCDTNGCISEQAFLNQIKGLLANQVVGYAVFVGSQPAAFGGQARTAADPPIEAMLPYLPTNIASVSKTLTAVGVLKELQAKGLTIDSAVSPYIYSDWSQGPNISNLTFRALMTQHAFPACNNTNYASLKTLVANGISPFPPANSRYSNCNFAIFREILPVMLNGQSAYAQLNDTQRANKAAADYIGYMDAAVFSPLGIPSVGGGTASCNPPPAGTQNEILSYPNPPDAIQGTDWGDWTALCGGGGWVLTPADIFLVINDLATGNVLLSNSQKKLMFDNYLGWDNTVRGDCPSPYSCKNGDLWRTVPSGQSTVIESIWTYAGIFKCTVPVVVVVNSPLPAPYQPLDNQGNPINGAKGDIIGLVGAAYAAVNQTPGQPTACPY